MIDKLNRQHSSPLSLPAKDPGILSNRHVNCRLFAPWNIGRVVLLGIALWSASVTGCGESATPESDVVTPPEPQATQTNPEKVAPGGMELPDDLAPATDAPAASSGAPIELPEMNTSPNPDDQSSNASDLPTVGYASWEEIQTMATKPGKIKVLDLWSLSCEPCLKEFPQLVRLHQESGDTIECVGVNLDFDGRKTRPPEYYQTNVAKFLASTRAGGFSNYICSTPSDDVYAAADIDSIPTVLVYGADGTLVKAFVDAGETLGFTYEKDVFPLIEKLQE